MAYTQQDIDNLSSAIAKGITKAKQGDEEVEYRSLGEMLRVKKIMEAELSGIKARPLNIQYINTSRGL